MGLCDITMLQCLDLVILPELLNGTYFTQVCTGSVPISFELIFRQVSVFSVTNKNAMSRNTTLLLYSRFINVNNKSSSLSRLETHIQLAKCRPTPNWVITTLSLADCRGILSDWWQTNYTENPHEFQKTTREKRSQRLHTPKNLQKVKPSSSEEPRPPCSSHLSPAVVLYNRQRFLPEAFQDELISLSPSHPFWLASVPTN